MVYIVALLMDDLDVSLIYASRQLQQALAVAAEDQGVLLMFNYPHHLQNFFVLISISDGDIICEGIDPSFDVLVQQKNNLENKNAHHIIASAWL